MLLPLLLKASAIGNAAAVEKILEMDPSLVNQAGPHPFWGGKPHALHTAAEWGRPAVVKVLLARGADPNIDSSAYGGWKPLHCAIHADHEPSGHPEVVNLLIAAGADVDIWAAAALGDLARVEGFLTADAQLVHAKGPNRATPLHFASTVAVAERLLAGGAKLDDLDCYGKTPACTVAGYGGRRRACALFLTAKTGDMDARRACRLGELEVLRGFLDADPVRLDEEADDETLLTIAALHGHEAVLRELLSRGADPNKAPKSGVSALHQAARNGHLVCIRLLLDAGADRTRKENWHDATPADWADFHGYTQAAALLG